MTTDRLAEIKAAYKNNDGLTGHTIRELLAEIERLIAEVERLTEDNEEAKMIARAEAKLEDDEPDLMATSQAQRNLFKLLHREQLDAGR